MASKVLEEIAKTILKVGSQIEEAEELVSALEEAGESVLEQKQKIHNLCVRREKWVVMLKARGIM